MLWPSDVTAEGEKQPKQVNQSLLTVLIALLANLLIASCEVGRCRAHLVGVDAGTSVNRLTTSKGEHGWRNPASIHDASTGHSVGRFWARRAG